MSLPTLFLGLLIATLYGTAFHFWRGGSGWRWIIYVFLSLIGFWVGHFVAASQGWGFVAIGALKLGGATIGSALFLLIGHWLGRIQKKGR